MSILYPKHHRRFLVVGLAPLPVASDLSYPAV